MKDPAPAGAGGYFSGSVSASLKTIEAELMQ
jgi:hypothetical protein